MSFYICLHNTYQFIELALFNNDSALKKITLSKENASAHLVPQLDQLLKDNNLSLNALSCFIVNQGPAPFTTLRTMIATANGISFAAKIPLIGVDGMTTLLREYAHEQLPTVVLLNAFNKAVYFAIQQRTTQPVIGYESISTFLTKLKDQFPQCKINFIGNGSSLYETEIRELLGDYAYFAEPLPQVASIEFIFKQGLEQWHQKQFECYQLEPLYLKRPLT